VLTRSVNGEWSRSTRRTPTSTKLLSMFAEPNSFISLMYVQRIMRFRDRSSGSAVCKSMQRRRRVIEWLRVLTDDEGSSAQSHPDLIFRVGRDVRRRDPSHLECRRRWGSTPLAVSSARDRVSDAVVLSGDSWSRLAEGAGAAQGARDWTSPGCRRNQSCSTVSTVNHRYPLLCRQRLEENEGTCGSYEATDH